MSTTNIDLSDRLIINGQIGTKKHIEINKNEVNTIYVAFENVASGRIRINEDNLIARSNIWYLLKGKKYQYSFLSTE